MSSGRERSCVEQHQRRCQLHCQARRRPVLSRMMCGSRMLGLAKNGSGTRVLHAGPACAQRVHSPRLGTKFKEQLQQGNVLLTQVPRAHRGERTRDTPRPSNCVRPDVGRRASGLFRPLRDPRRRMNRRTDARLARVAAESVRRRDREGFRTSQVERAPRSCRAHDSRTR